ncbi:MAG: FecR domain-containing protein [Spongiibacteraceae bacterium]|nr:FecR domain-containing protein [Spongiibacteraceae bacterium]
MMESKFTPHCERVNKEASEWFSLMQSGNVSEQDRLHLEQWLAVSEEHRDAYQQLEVIWDDLAQMLASRQGQLLRDAVDSSFIGKYFLNVKQRIHYFLSPKVWVPTLTVIMLGLFLVLQTQTPSVNIYSTRVGEIKTLTLHDGSKITLGAKSTIRAWSDSLERHVVLETGQAFFVVTKDAERPFWVDAKDTRIKVVGTAFDVHSNKDRIRVAVLEGVVNVSAQASGDAYSAANVETSKAVVLIAGQQVVKPRAEKFSVVSDISENELTAWRQGRLVYRNARLEDVIGDVNRYYDGTIVLQTQSLAEQKVTLALNLDRVEMLPSLLAQSLSLSLHKKSDKRIELSLEE